LLEALPNAGVRRLLFVGGGGSLRDTSGRRFVDSPDFPAEYLETALDQAEALDVLRRSTAAVDWTYLSPPPLHLVPGDKTGTYRAAAIDEPIGGDDGDSRISVGDFASAAVDALEDGTFVREGSLLRTDKQAIRRSCAWSLLIPYTPNRAGAGTAR
jgi:putative NADH-flavin reductase